MESFSNTFRISLGGWGKNKKSVQGSDWDTGEKLSPPDVSTLMEKYSIKINPSMSSTYGQDFMGYHQDKEIFIIANADGHGGKLPLAIEGTKFAMYSVFFSIAEIYKHRNEIKKIHTDKDRLSEYMNHLFQGLDNFLIYDFPETKGATTGGSTLTVNLKFYSKGRLVSVTTNAGDSTLSGFSSNRIEEKTMTFNCDTLEAYQKYVDKCNTRSIKPFEVYLGRFNFRKGYKIHWAGTNGKPIKPFVLEKCSNTYKVTENTSTMEKFYNNAPQFFRDMCLSNGGIQSIRDKQKNIDGIKQGKYPYTNFGNTAEGICQCLPGSSIGDACQKNNMTNIMLTHTHVEYIKKRHVEIIGSDGFFDMMTDECIREILADFAGPSSDTSLETTKSRLVEKMFSEVKKYQFPANWDDITFCIINTTPKKNSKENKFKKKRQAQKKRKKLNKYS